MSLRVTRSHTTKGAHHEVSAGTNQQRAAEAREWFDRNVATRLRRGGPSADITFEAFCVEYLARWEPGVATRTRSTLHEWLGCPLERVPKSDPVTFRERVVPGSVRTHFGRWTLAELEGAADDIARWHAEQPSEYAR